jgi:TonB family protein
VSANSPSLHYRSMSYLKHTKHLFASVAVHATALAGLHVWQIQGASHSHFSGERSVQSIDLVMEQAGDFSQPEANVEIQADNRPLQTDYQASPIPSDSPNARQVSITKRDWTPQLNQLRQELTIPMRPPILINSKQVVDQGNSDQPVAFTHSPPPQYPTLAVQHKWEGVVKLMISIDDKGYVVEVSVVDSSGFDVLDEAAISAVRNWRGLPASRNGKAISTTEILPIRFRL